MSGWKRVISPITVASVTTFATFCALAMAQLRGFADLGLAGALVSAGVYLACITLLPVVLLSCPERGLTNRTAISVPLRRLADVIQVRGALVIGSMILLTVIAAFSVSELRYLSDVRHLEGTDLQSRILQQRIAAEYGLSASPIILNFEKDEDAVEFMADDERPASIASLVDVPDVPGLLQVHPIQNPFIRDHYQAVNWDIEHQIERLELGNWQLSGAPAMNARIDQLLYADIRFVLPLAAGYLTNRWLIRSRGQEWFKEKFLPRLKPVSILALLTTLVLIFAFQGDVIVAKPQHILLIAIPLTIQTYLIFFITWFAGRKLKLNHAVCAPSAMIGASNFFELAVAVAIVLFGLNSGAVLATVVGVLIEVPVMLSLVKLANKWKY